MAEPYIKGNSAMTSRTKWKQSRERESKRGETRDRRERRERYGDVK
jgi:hypothetical protein